MKFIINNYHKCIELRKKNKCPFCKKDMTNPKFRDSLSKKEFEISGLCQKCQDETFKEEKNEIKMY